MTHIIPSRERSAGLGIEWHEIEVPTIVHQLNPGLGTRAFASEQSKCTVMVSHGQQWHISVAHPFRYPTWDEIAAARYALVPDDVTMAMMLPPEAEYVNLHSNCFHLHECRCERDRR